MRNSVKFLAVWLAVSLLSFGASSKVSPDLQKVDPNSNVRVIVQYSQMPSGVSPQSGGGLLGGVLGLVGGLVNGVVNLVLSTLNAVVYTIPASSLQSLANDPNVTYISPDRLVAGRLDYSAAAVNANAAWKANLTGFGVGEIGRAHV